MTKRKTTSKKNIPQASKVKKKAVQNVRPPLKSWQKDLLICLMLTGVLLVFFAPFVFQDQVYEENDNLQSAIIDNQIAEHLDQTGEIAYWNPNPWGGIPNVFRIPRNAPSLDFFLTALTKALSLPFVFFLWGGIGMYFLARHLQFGHLLSAIGALLFILAPFYKSLVVVGHLAKLQSLMHLPWVLWSVLLLIKKPKLLNVLFFTLTFGMLLRANHYQIVFYCGFLVLFVWLAHLWPLIQAKNWHAMGRRIGLFAVAGLFALLIAAQPMLTAFKYAGHSVRGQQVIDLKSEQFEGDRGVSKEFVRTWSFTPSELLTLIVPRAKGGLSDDVYPSAHFIGFKDGEVGSYWGHGPFNATYYYVGALALLLLSFGVIHQYRDYTFVGLAAVSLLMLLWSLGTFFQPFYDLCYLIIPFFKNFRTPPTSLSILNVTVPIMVLYGARSIKDMAKPKKIWISIGLFFLFGIGMLVYAESASYLKAGEDTSTKMVQALQGIRKEMLLNDVYRYLILISLGSGLVFLYFYRKLGFQPLLILFSLLMLTDAVLIQQRYPFKTISRQNFERTHLAPSPTVRFLQNDPESFRVVPFSTTNFGLPAHVQTIGGGFDLQMNRASYEVSLNCLHHKLDGRMQLNWNVLNMLNVKYIVAEQELSHPYLSLEHTDEVKQLYAHRYKFDRPRGFFVDNYEVITDDRTRLQRLNNANLDIRATALLEKDPGINIQPASRSHTEVLSLSPNKILYNVDAVADGLFVMSDIYAPDIQEVYLDGDRVNQVFKTNHMLQSIIVPKGFHTIELRYKGGLFKLSGGISQISWFLLYGLVALLIFKNYRRDGKGLHDFLRI